MNSLSSNRESPMLNNPQAAARLRMSVFQQAVLLRPERRFTFACYGKRFRGKDAVNWSFAPLKKPEDAAANPELCGRLAAVFSALGVRRVFAPSPIKSNARFIPNTLLRTEIPVSRNISLRRNGDEPADATMLCPGEGGAITAGGCCMIIAENGDRCVWGHGSRKGILDPERIRCENPGSWRLHASVVDSMLQALGIHTIDRVNVWVYGAIHPTKYPHPLSGQYGAFNRAMLSYAIKQWGRLAEESMRIKDGAILLDVPGIIKTQFASYGVPPKNINLRHAYLSDEEAAWLDGAPGKGRNLFAVVGHG